MNYSNNLLKLTLFSFVLIMSSCEDEDLGASLSEAETKLSENYILAESAISNVYNIVDVAVRDSVFIATDSAVIDGASVIRNGNQIIIDYGNGVIGADGLTRKGNISIAETGDYKTAGSLDVTLSQYVLDDKPVSGALDVTNNGTGQISLAISGFSVDNEFVLNSSKSISWVQGFTTIADPDDDKYELSGTAQAHTIVNHDSLSATITEVMVYDRQCAYGLVSGVIDLSFRVDSASESTAGNIDFIVDDGCDNVAKITIEQGESSFTISRQFSGF